MRTYKPDVDSLRSELYHHHQPVVVAFNIENIVLVANIVNTIKGTFYICEHVQFALLVLVNQSSRATFAWGFFV